jgi:hypothetical protein
VKWSPSLLCLSLLCIVLAGCGARSGGEGPPSSSQRSEVTGAEGGTTTARVVCDGGGVSVLTPEVASRPDGVHIAIDNRLRGSADLSVSHPGGGMGWSVPSGESSRVANVPPGKVKIDCFSRSWGREKLFAMGTETLRVLAGASGYKSTKLECERGRSEKIGPLTKEETEEQKGDPVEIFRRTNAGSIHEGDVVEAAGNTRSQDERTVRVVRDGRVVATAHYLRFSKGWMEATEESCAGF